MARLLVFISLCLVLAGNDPASAGVTSCPGFGPPVDGPVLAGFAPVGRYAGHWGVDLVAVPDQVVRSPGSGRVTFAGSVAGRLSVTIELGPELVATVSYLGSVSVPAGARLSQGEVVGTAGRAHGTDSVHLSVRVDGEYVDPMTLLSCRMGAIPDALRLVE